jgi:anti-anti-sigma regulatory factor
MTTTTSYHGAPTWVTTDDLSDDVVVVTAVGGLAAYRGVELWAELEGALERAAGRLVVADFLAVTGFDVYTIDSLARVARASRRRRLDLCAVMHPSGALGQYARSCRLDTLVPIYDSVPTALAGASADLPAL